MEGMFNFLPFPIGNWYAFKLLHIVIIISLLTFPYWELIPLANLALSCCILSLLTFPYWELILFNCWIEYETGCFFLTFPYWELIHDTMHNLQCSFHLPFPIGNWYNYNNTRMQLLNRLPFPIGNWYSRLHQVDFVCCQSLPFPIGKNEKNPSEFFDELGGTFYWLFCIKNGQFTTKNSKKFMNVDCKIEILCYNIVKSNEKDVIKKWNEW